jgi:LL-diaminopimelate aminotransferase
MIRINENYLKLQSSYLFVEINRRAAASREKHGDRETISLGIGDVTRALPASCIRAFRAAVDEMGSDATFRGYGPEQGYGFLREAIARHDFRERNADITADEIFISDGAKCDTGNIQELFAADTVIAVPDPVYPVYVDTNVMAGRTADMVDERYNGLVYLDCAEENGFVPPPPPSHVDLAYLCFPNNPTGATATKGQLAAWVAYARREKALILFDAAYEAYIRSPDVPHSIFEIDGARDVAIEFRSFSKTAGFTGIRCACTVIPRTCGAWDRAGNRHALHALWSRRHTTKFNGVSYPVQRAAEACCTGDGPAQVRELADYYMSNAALIRDRMTALGYSCAGGKDAPYVWVNVRRDSWEFFDLLLEKAGVVCTPGAGFGRCGRGYVRLSAFNSRENTAAALDRIAKAFG